MGPEPIPPTTLMNGQPELDDDLPLAQRLLALQKKRAAELAVTRNAPSTATKIAPPPSHPAAKRAEPADGAPLKSKPLSSELDGPARKMAKRTTTQTPPLAGDGKVVKTKSDPNLVKVKPDPGVIKDYQDPFLQGSELYHPPPVVPSKKLPAVKKDPAEKTLGPTKTTLVPAKKIDPAKKADKKARPADAQYDDEQGDGEEYCWWEAQNNDGSVKWTTLEHNGLYFPPPYEPHGIPLIYNGQALHLEPAAEEVASFFAAIIGTDHHDNEIFRKNFFEDFSSILHSIDSAHRHIIRELEKCDFGRISEHLATLREARKNLGKEERQRLKEEKAQIDELYGYCLLDGRKEKVGNFRVEPPGLFRGRGKHPKAGKLKQRVLPEQVTINIGPGARVPEPPAGHAWGGIVHDNTVTWLATWVENVNKGTKYVFLAPGSSLKGQSDLKKFETARQLARHVKAIRRANAEELRHKEMFVRQRATALWLIDRLALRAGNEKGDDEADTVGCCSLRCEHVRLVEPNTVIFDFLGKDSIRYYNEVTVDPIIFKNLNIFMRPPKSKDDLIFDRLSTSLLNKYLTGLMAGLTAKVFRTYNASHTFQKELEKTPDIQGDTPANVQELVLAYNRANRQVAILCNHQRSIPKTHQQSMERLNEKILTIKYQRHLVRGQLRKLLSRKELKKECPDALEDESDMDDETVARKAKEADEALLAKAKAKAEAEGADIASSGSSPRRGSSNGGNGNGRQPNRETLIKKFQSLNMRIEAAKSQRVDKDENKTTSLGTSKTNYIDPRITAAWCQKHNVPLERLFNKSLREKFKWAMTVKPNWKF